MRISIDKALDIYRNPQWYSVGELQDAAQRFYAAADEADTDAQADEWNALGQLLAALASTRY